MCPSNHVASEVPQRWISKWKNTPLFSQKMWWWKMVKAVDSSSASVLFLVTILDLPTVECWKAPTTRTFLLIRLGTRGLIYCVASVARFLAAPQMDGMVMYCQTVAFVAISILIQWFDVKMFVCLKDTWQLSLLSLSEAPSLAASGATAESQLEGQRKYVPKAEGHWAPDYEAMARKVSFSKREAMRP